MYKFSIQRVLDLIPCTAIAAVYQYIGNQLPEDVSRANYEMLYMLNILQLTVSNITVV
jgi:hypothetical protein